MRYWLAQSLRNDRLRCGPGVWWLTRQHLVQHTGQTVLVTARVEARLRHRLLRAHVRRGGQREAGLGEPAPSCLGHCERDAEIRDQRMAPGEQDVLWLDVATDDALV